MDQLLSLLTEDARLTNAELASALSISEEEVAARIADYEERGVIKGYKAIVDWDKTDRDYVNARIEIRVTPKKGMGFEEIASVISRFDEVESVYLMSGTCDIALTVSGKSFKDVAMFVAHRLSTLESVQSTSTSFVLRTYKELGVYVSLDEIDEREVASL
ncbi:MAG: Lrp/AsnC family transcriptional regulator [Clostridiales bacterium]|nr:Lrp/AsnC family transcriptional regulator [Clostridiales bacterium]